MIDIFISVHLLRITSRPDILIPPETRINTTKKTPSPQLYICKNSAFSASSGVRTLDTLIKSQVLYQLS